MKVASLELCKELYELSGWEETYWSWAKWKNEDGDIARIPTYQFYGRPTFAPAYDLGYLREKLVTSPITQSEVEKALYGGVDATAMLCIQKIRTGDIYVEAR